MHKNDNDMGSNIMSIAAVLVVIINVISFFLHQRACVIVDLISVHEFIQYENLGFFLVD
jgi:hypothetical protein